jgi:AAA family ATP:ADP antiporter
MQILFQGGPILMLWAALNDDQVVGYAVAKPAKEVLYTVVAREDMYKAKLCIDTLVLRGGDMLAAAVFHVLVGSLQFGEC